MKIEPANVNGLTELTEEFLSFVGYPKIHKDWSQWESEAKAYGLTEAQILELKNFLEQNKQLTVPVTFNGRRYWLTENEETHLKLTEQFLYDPEHHLDYLMRTGLFGDVKSDHILKRAMKQKSVKRINHDSPIR